MLLDLLKGMIVCLLNSLVMITGKRALSHYCCSSLTSVRGQCQQIVIIIYYMIKLMSYVDIWMSLIINGKNIALMQRQTPSVADCHHALPCPGLLCTLVSLK